eukprot:CAMPEP_0168559540 /NCGR_PEP_ID=MMETSP0413-20121227/10580_1 /TAXON_ID=136452 /ORGANISM="Filamoeba nolandi, Strain NC-AS-23-1" /LENGTH=137 /DNA_ID=CAMNT_0008590779 /DNA_START=33 /DNA_END=446 /DNA_ORIENTATION=-
MKNTLVVLFIVLGLAQFITAYSVFGYVKNGFSSPVKLVNVTLSAGEWVTEPSDSINGPSTDYVFFFEVDGDSGVAGSIEYALPPQQGITVTATFYFKNDASGNSYTAFVAPSPWIGGVNGVTGTTNATVDYYLHQMC